MRGPVTPGGRALVCALLIGCLALLHGACSNVTVTSYYSGGALATSAAIATDLGEQVFDEGGNAVDVAVAVGFALAVVYPQAGNIGGGGFALVYDAASDSIQALDFRETAPLAAGETMYLDDSGNVIDGLSTVGARAAGVPGTVAGLYALWQRYGSMPWEDLVSRSAILADTGFVVDSFLAASLYDHREELLRYEETARAYLLSNGRAPEPGQRVKYRELAASLFAIAAEGPDGFYGGRTADRILATMEKHGGLITREDLENYRTIWRDPLHFTFDSLDIYSMPPPSSGGVIVGQILKLLEPYDFSSYFPSSPEYMHRFIEAARLAYADRSMHLGDPSFYNVPRTLLSEQYLDRRRGAIDEEHASPSANVRPGSPPISESPQTTHFSVADSSGNLVSITYTLNTAYGSKLVVDSAGFLLNNEMDDFSAKPGAPNVYGLVGGEANKIEPGKRMLSSMSPTLVFKHGAPVLVLGSPGGSRIITTVAQALINYSRFEYDVRELVSAPRFHHQWLPDRVYLEEGRYEIQTKQALIRYGHDIQEQEPWCDLQVVLISDGGLMAPASDPRRGGKASGY